jgi:formate--tetrahydrofolate ligase
MLDASILHGNACEIDPLAITWKRALDVNDRALRQIAIGLGGRVNGYPREAGFDITAASEVMAIVAMSRDLADLRARLAAITVGYAFDGRPVTAEDLRAAGSMAVLLRDAIKPNLVQTLEGQPCLIHCGPFANIAHGNSSLISTLIGRKLGDYFLTESGFGSDMGMEKFFDIVCRAGALKPDCVVLVATVRALQHHGFMDDGADGGAKLAAIERGIVNLARHLAIVGEYGVPCVVAVNRRPEDSDAEVQLVKRLALEHGAHAAEVNDGFAHGGAGAADLARAVVDACEQPSAFDQLYPLDATIREKIEAVATRVYGASAVTYLPEAERKVERYTADGLDRLPVCMAKTPLSLSADPGLLGVPEDFTIQIRDIRAYTGAGWLVPLCGDIMQMPGLGETPAAHKIDLLPDGRIVGLF